MYFVVRKGIVKVNAIFNAIMEYTGVEYLSDLHSRSVWGAVISFLEDLGDDDYPVEQWNEAINYIFGLKVSFSTVGQAKIYLTSM